MKSMKLGAAFLAAALAFIGTISFADTPQPTQTADWFTAGFNGEDTKWTVPADAAAFENDTLVLDTDDDEEVVYTPEVIQKDTNKITVKTTVKMEPCIGLPDVPDPEDTQKTSFALVKVDDTLAYYALTKVDTTVAWVKLAGVVPVEGAVVTVTADFDYSGAGTVTYAVGNDVLYKDGDSTATALPLLSATKASSFSYSGSGTVSLLDGDYRDADRQFAVANAATAGGFDYYATEAAAQAAVGEGGAYLAFNSTGGVWDEKTAPLFVAEVFGSDGTSKGKAASLTAAVGLAAAGDVIKVIKDVAEDTVTVDKSVTITSDLVTKPVLNNVSITGKGSGVELTVTNLMFSGNSWINAGGICALSVLGVEAHVRPDTKTLTNSRGAFVCLGRSEVNNPSLRLTVKNCIIDSANAVDQYSGAIIGWHYLGDGSEISNNVLGTEDNPFRWIAIKTMDAADGAVITIKDNVIYGTNHYYDFQAFDFYQNNSRANTYTVLSENNVINVAIDNESNGVLAFEIECNTLGNDGHCILFDNGTTLNGEAITFNDIEETWNNGQTVVIRGETLRAAVCYGINAEFDENGKLIAGTVSDNVPSLFAPGYEAVAQGTTPETWVVQEKAASDVVQIGELKYDTLDAAFTAAKTGDKVVLIGAATGEATVPAGKALTLDATDAGSFAGSIAVADTASLAIRGGKYNLSALTGAVTLYGGIYATAPEAAFVATGYEVANNPDTETATAYPKKVQEPTVTTEDDAPIVIDIDPTAHEGQGESVPVVVTQDLAKEILGVEVTTLTEEQKVAVTNALQTAGEDGMTGWQKYTAGFKQTDKHPLAPKGRGGEDGKLVLVTSLVAPKQLSVDTGVKVKYILMQGSNVSPTTGLPLTWTKVQELPTPEFPVDVTKLASETYWKIEVEYTATKKVVETEVDPAE